MKNTSDGHLLLESLSWNTHSHTKYEWRTKYPHPHHFIVRVHSPCIHIHRVGSKNPPYKHKIDYCPTHESNLDDYVYKRCDRSSIILPAGVVYTTFLLVREYTLWLGRIWLPILLYILFVITIVEVCSIKRNYSILGVCSRQIRSRRIFRAC